MAIQNVCIHFLNIQAYHSKYYFMPEIMKHKIKFKNLKLKCVWTSNGISLI